MTYHAPHWTGDKPICLTHGHAFKPCFARVFPTVPWLHVCTRCGRLGLKK